jgi:2-polyprenyl-3-methyl-5-hydroxy-6-metoxy-1,4-benzoquinol methylase
MEVDFAMSVESEINTGEYYDKDYFEAGNKSHYGSYNDYPFFKDLAKYLKDKYSPKSVLEVGCAKGFVIKWLNNFGVNAYGIDISKYAISCAEYKDKTLIGDIRDIKFEDNKFDIVLCLETLEHVIPTDTDKAISELKRVTNNLIMISMPITKTVHVITDDDKEKSHINIHTEEFWREAFKKHNLEVISLSNWLIPRDNNKTWELTNVFILKKIGEIK